MEDQWNQYLSTCTIDGIISAANVASASSQVSLVFVRFIGAFGL